MFPTYLCTLYRCIHRVLGPSREIFTHFGPHATKFAESEVRYFMRRNWPKMGSTRYLCADFTENPKTRRIVAVRRLRRICGGRRLRPSSVLPVPEAFGARLAACPTRPILRVKYSSMDEIKRRPQRLAEGQGRERQGLMLCPIADQTNV